MDFSLYCCINAKKARLILQVLTWSYLSAFRQASAAQSPPTSPGPAYCNYALGYIGTSNDTVVPNFKLYVDGAVVASLYACGDGNGGVSGGNAPCILDGLAHYIPLTTTFTQTDQYTYTDFDFTFLFTDPNADTNTLTALLDAVDCQLSS
jgi:hypothetical protein